MKNSFRVDGAVAYIFITNRKGATYTVEVDSEDIEKLISAKSSWYINEYSPGSIRVQGRVCLEGKVLKTSMHRFLLNFPLALVDHIDSNTLNNSKSNLRLATKSENAQNYKGARSDSKSGILGVYWSTGKKLWVASIQVDGVSIRKYCHTLEEAACYTKELRKQHMPFSKEAREAE